MATMTYPVGYGRERVTMSVLRSRHEPHMIPAMSRRLFAWLEFMGGRVGLANVPGCGGGRRTYQPNKPGFAQPIWLNGELVQTSFHFDQRFANGVVGYSAWDLVVGGAPGQNHRSPTWAETATAPQFGLHTFISGEPWHIQCIEMRGFMTWHRAGRPYPRLDFPLPGQPKPPPTIPTGAVDYNPPKSWWWFPLDKAKPTLEEGARDNSFIGHVRYLQDAIYFGAGGNITRDGHFGPETGERVADLQHIFNLKEDEIVGPKTWGAVDYVALKTVPNPVKSVSPVMYYVRSGDSPWRAGERVYGSGTNGMKIFQESQFAKPYVHIPVPFVKGITIKVQHDGEAVGNLLKRMGLPASQANIFYDYNGGSTRTFKSGNDVYMPV